MSDQTTLSFLTDDNQEQGYVKAGFLGFPKSGKSYTATLLAAGIRRHFKQDGPIAMFDTESGSVYLQPTVAKLTQKKLLAKKGRSLEMMMQWAKACVEHGVSVGIVDSVTHPWKEVQSSYLDEINRWRERKGLSKQRRIEFQDNAVINQRWEVWTEFYLNAPLHLIVCGRAANEYEWEDRDDGSGKKDLVKTGIKMRCQNEFGFEPSLLIEMERETIPGKSGAYRKATIVGDRFAVIDGAEFCFASVNDPEKAEEAVFNAFRPHVELLTPGAHAVINTECKTRFEFTENGEDSWAHEKKQRTILCEEIQGLLLKHYPGQTAAEKKAKSDAIDAHLGTRSWTQVENMKSEVLRNGLETLRAHLSTIQSQAA